MPNILLEGDPDWLVISEPTQDHGVARRISKAKGDGEFAKLKDSDGDNVYVNPDKVIRVVA